MSLTVNDNAATIDETDVARIVALTIEKASRIATLPAVAVQIIRLCEQPDTTVEQMTRVIDPVLGLKILKLVNSAYYGLSGQVKTIRHAIVMLGLTSVKNIAIAASLVKMISDKRLGTSFKASDLWAHSVAVGTAAQMLARKSRCVPADEAFLAGLLHDLGIIVEMQACGPEFVQIIQNVEADENLTFRAAEEQVLGFNHEVIGAGLCKSWHLPKSLELSVGYHHRPWELDEQNRILPGLVHIADVLVGKTGLGYTRTVEVDTVEPSLLDGVELTEQDLDAVAGQLPAAVLESQRLLSGDN